MSAPRTRAKLSSFWWAFLAVVAWIPITGCGVIQAITEGELLVQNPTITVTTNATTTKLVRGGTLQVAIGARFAGGPTRATLSLGGTLPTGVTASFSPGTITDSVSSTLTLTASATADTGIFVYNVVATESGSNNNVVSRAQLNAQVEVPFLLRMSSGQSVNAGMPTSFTLSAARGTGFTAPVALALVPTSVPPGTTSSFTSPTILTGTSSLDVVIPANAQPGRWIVRVVGTSGSIVDTIGGLLTIQAAPVPPEIFVTAAPASVTVAPGASADFDLAFVVNSSTPILGTIVPTVAGLPAGASATFTPVTTTPTSRLSIATTPAIADGIYPLTITATLGTLVKTTNVTLVVQTPANFSMSLTPASITVARNAVGSVDVALQRVGAMGDVTIDAQSVPAGVTVVSAPIVATSVVNSTKLSIGVNSTAAAGTYPIIVRGVGGGITKTTTLSLTIPAPPPNNVTIELPTSSINIAAGATTQIPIKLTRTGTAVGMLLELRSAGFPIGGNAWISPSFTTGDSAVLTVIGGLPGTSNVAVSVALGAFPPTAVAAINVQASSTPNFSLTPAPQTLNMNAGQSVTMGVEIGRTNGFTGPVSFTAIGDAPGNFNVTFSLNSTTGSGIGMTVIASGSVSAGPHTILIRGTSGAVVREVPMTVVIAAGGGGGGCTYYPYCYGYGIKAPPH